MSTKKAKKQHKVTRKGNEAKEQVIDTAASRGEEETQMDGAASSTIQSIQDSYNEFTYQSKPFTHTSIEYLQTIGAFRGIPTIPADRARVLEIGTSFGGNIMGQAAYHPNATFVGIDLSEQQVKVGQAIIKEMGLTNIRLEVKNIMDITPDFGTFDYIIVHGIYSWVPDVVKDKILEICRQNLSANGIAYVSYNTYPGWKRGDIVRDMMMYANIYHQNLPLEERTLRSKAVAGVIGDMIDTMVVKSKYQDGLKESIDKVLKDPNYYVAHEYLEDVNDPIYFHEMMKRSQDHDLVYVCDAELFYTCKMTLGDGVRKKVEQLAQGDRFIVEQCIDYYLGTTFRRSLFTHPAQVGNVNTSERVSLDWLDRIKMMGSEALRAQEPMPIVHVVCNEFINTHRLFTAQDIMHRLATKADELDKEGNAIVASELRSYTKVDIYSFLVRCYVLGHIRFYLGNEKNIDFEDNQVIVRPELANYYGVLIANQTPVSIGDKYNRLIGNVNDSHVIIMKALETPKTKQELIDIVKVSVKVTRNDQVVPPEQVVDEVLRDLSNFCCLERVQSV